MINDEEEVINLLSKIMNLKSALVDHVIRQHGKFDCLETEIEDIANNFDVVHIETENIISKSAKVSEALFLTIEDREKYQKQVDSLKTIKDIVMDLLVLNKHICNLQNFNEETFELSEESLDKISQELEAVNNTMKNSSAIRMQELTAHKALMSSCAAVKVELTAKIERLWQENIKINNNTANPHFDYARSFDYGEYVPECKSIEILIHQPLLESLVRLMFHLNIGSLYVGLLLRFITLEILNPTIENFQTYSLSVVVDECLILKTAARMKPNNLSDKRSIIAFIKSFTEALSNLKSYLLIIEIPGRYATILDMFQKEHFNDPLTEHLITHFLNEITVTDSILPELEAFISFLHKENFISSSNQVLTDFVKSSDRRARYNDVTNLLSNTRNLYSKSILDCSLIHDDPISFNKLDEEPSLSIKEEISHIELLDVHKVMFPPCKVSSMVVDSIESIVETIIMFESARDFNELENNLTQVTDFLHTLPEMIMMYLYVVPLTNRDVLDQLPLASVLHYNNCMYMAHHCLHWTTKIKSFIDIIKSQNADNINDTDDVLCKIAPSILLPLVYEFREAAVECFTKEMDKQKQTLSDFFDGISSFRGVGSDNKERIHKIVKKCGFHLSLLNKAYDALPSTIFDHIYGSLVDWAIEELLSKVLNMTDIVKADNEELIILLNEFRSQIVIIVVKRQMDTDDNTTIKLTSDIEDVANEYILEYFAKWNKLLEMKFVMENGLQAIHERWIEAEKSMSQHLSAGEVRNMIKALFKNSHIRAKVIESIV